MPPAHLMTERGGTPGLVMAKQDPAFQEKVAESGMVRRIDAAQGLKRPRLLMSSARSDRRSPPFSCSSGT